MRKNLSLNLIIVNLTQKLLQLPFLSMKFHYFEQNWVNKETRLSPNNSLVFVLKSNAWKQFCLQYFSPQLFISSNTIATITWDGHKQGYADVWSSHIQGLLLGDFVFKIMHSQCRKKCWKSYENKPFFDFFYIQS